MRKPGAVLLTAVFLTVLSLPVYAERLKEATVDYSADSVMESGGIKIDSKVYHSGKMTRIEQETDGVSQIIILRNDRKKALVLMPQMQMYMEVDYDALGAAISDPNDMDYTLAFEGPETIDGVMTRRNRMTALGKDGKRFEGRLWLSADGIMMKIDATAMVKGRPEQVTMELRNLKIGPIRRSFFEAPDGYTKMKPIGNESPQDMER